MTFRKLKLSDNRPSRPALNFRGKCRNTMLFSPKTRVMSAIAELTPKKKTGRGRKSLSSSVRDNCRLCGCSFKVKFGSQARHIGTENLFQPSKQKGSFGVILAKLCESVGLPVKYCEDKSDRVCSSCGRKIRNLHQLFSFVLSALINSDNENSDSSEERFKRCLPTSVSSPDRSPLSRKIQKEVHGRVADQEIAVDRREENKLGALGCLTLTGACQFSNLRHVCGDNFHALQCTGVSGVEMKFYERRLQALPFSSPPPAVASPLACLSRVHFSRYPPNGELARRLLFRPSGRNETREEICPARLLLLSRLA